MKRYILAVLVKNQFGVLNRVTSMFRRRQFNISTLTVSETESSAFSRITVLFEGDSAIKEQLIDQLYKLNEVVSIKELGSDSSITRELLLIKMKNDPTTREEIRSAQDAFGAKTVDYSKESIILQLTGNTQKIDDFINLMRDFEILEICRTGVVSLERGGETIIKNTEN